MDTRRLAVPTHRTGGVPIPPINLMNVDAVAYLCLAFPQLIQPNPGRPQACPTREPTK
jgi:hypothetical protein